MSALRLAATCLMAILASARAPALAPPQSEPAGEIVVAPVVLDGRALFSVRGVSAFTAEERADAIVERIRVLAEDETFDPATLRSEEIPGGGRLATPDGRLVMNIYDADSVAEGFSREGVSTAILVRVRQAILDYRAARTPEALTSATVRSVAALLILALGGALVILGARRIEDRLELRYRARLPHLGIGSFEILRAERIWSALRALTSLLRLLLCLVLAFVCLRYALGQFAATRAMADSLDDMVLGPLQRLGLGALNFLPDLIFLVVLTFVARWFIRLSHMFFLAVERGTVRPSNFEPEWAMPTYRLVRIAIIAFSVVVAYPYIPGSESGAFKGVSLFLGVLISIGSSSAISNIVAGYMLTYRRAFRMGDRVRIGDVTGEVSAVHLQVTQVRTSKNESVTIPNATILGSQVTNYSTLAARDGLLVHLTVGIGYETPWRQVEAMLLLAAERTEGLLRKPQPFVHQLALGDFSVTYELNAACDNPHQYLALRSALHRSVLDVFNEFGVQIMTPNYEGDPEQPKVVAREQWFTAPASDPASRG